MHSFLLHGIKPCNIITCTPWISFRSIVCESRYFSIQHKKQRSDDAGTIAGDLLKRLLKTKPVREQSPTQRRGVEGRARLSRRANNAARPSYIQRGRYPRTQSLLLTPFALFNKVALPTYRESRARLAGCGGGESEKGKWKGGSGSSSLAATTSSNRLLISQYSHLNRLNSAE